MSRDGRGGTTNDSTEATGRRHEELVARKLDDDRSTDEEREVISESTVDLVLGQRSDPCRQIGVAESNAESLQHESEFLECDAEPPAHGVGDAEHLDEEPDVKAEIASLGYEDGRMEEAMGADANGEHALEARRCLGGSLHRKREEEGHDEPVDPLKPVQNVGVAVEVLAQLRGATFVEEHKWFDVPDYLEAIGDREGRCVEPKRLGNPPCWAKRRGDGGSRV